MYFLVKWKAIFTEEDRGLTESFVTWCNHDHLKINISRTSGACGGLPEEKEARESEGRRAPSGVSVS